MVVEDTQGEESDGTGGRGMTVQLGATVDVTRALFSRNRDFGVIVMTPGTSAQLSDVVVSQTAEQACAATTCAHAPYGVALAGVSEATLVATRFEAQDSTLCGVLVAENGQVDLSQGQVSGSLIGACLQVEGYDTGRLTESVHYLDNGTSLDATRLPVPVPESPVGG
ncbi:MAG: hypothetical protein JRH11_25680 [Deltaproteobacteria bacterium]|nr:hypothetical protein [Deltaproteobacteria bacterium]